MFFLRGAILTGRRPHLDYNNKIKAAEPHHLDLTECRFSGISPPSELWLTLTISPNKFRRYPKKRNPHARGGGGSMRR